MAASTSFSAADIIWSPDEKRKNFRELISSVEFPQLLKVYREDGASPKVTLAFGEGDMLKLHGVKVLKKAVLKPTGMKRSRYTTTSFIEVHQQLQPSQRKVASEYSIPTPVQRSSDSSLTVPVGFSRPFQILPYREKSHIFCTAGDIIRETPRPSAVVVNKNITLFEKHTEIRAGDILGIVSVDKRCTTQGVVDFLICKHNDKTIGLPTSCVGNFTIMADEAMYTLSSMNYKKMDLPQRIKFVDSPKDDSAMTQTLARAGEALLDTSQEYILESFVKREYLVCTKCDALHPPANQRIYFLPTHGPQINNISVQLPLFRDIKTYKSVVNVLYCSNLSMRRIRDNSPIETAGESVMFICRLSDVFGFEPELPPRKQDTFTPTDNAFAPPHLSTATNIYGNVSSYHSRSGSEDSNYRAGNGKINHAGTASETSSILEGPAEDQPLLNPSRRGASTPSTPEYRRRKNQEPSHNATWTEKISVSLENLKRAFRKAGSEERDQGNPKGRVLGDGSRLADSFENLSVSNSDLTSSAQCSDYVNVNRLTNHMQANKNKPTHKKTGFKSSLPNGIPPSKCAQIKELWTPPCSPDYRDHTTSNIDSLNNSTSAFSYNNLSSTAAPKLTETPVLIPLQKSNTEPNISLATTQPTAAPRNKSPQVPPRKTINAPDPTSFYNNLSDFVSGATPPSRCSGYSSGGSETDLVNLSLEHIKTLDAIPSDLSSLTVSELGDCLLLFELASTAVKFKQNQIDGQFFMTMPDEMFRNDGFNLSEFEILKLKRLRDGWRPKF